MMLLSMNKLPNGLTPMLVTNVDTLGLITSIPLMLLSLTLAMKLTSKCTLPSIKVLMMNLGDSLISNSLSSTLKCSVKTTQLVIICVTMLMNGTMN